MSVIASASCETFYGDRTATLHEFMQTAAFQVDLYLNMTMTTTSGQDWTEETVKVKKKFRIYEFKAFYFLYGQLACPMDFISFLSLTESRVVNARKMKIIREMKKKEKIIIFKSLYYYFLVS